MGIGAELLNAPLPEMAAKLATSIAEAQVKLDTNSTEVAKFMASQKISLPAIDPSGGDQEFPLIALGFYPTFYAVQTAEIELKMAITMAKSKEFALGVKGKAGWGPFSASVNASYKSKYDYKQEGSSRMVFKMAPTPPPAMLEAYVEALIDMHKKSVEETINPPTNP